MSIRRFAAIDMYGTSGTMRRRRMVLAEFPAALAGMLALGIWLVVGAPSPGMRMLGIWVIGAGLNYAPLSANAIALSRPGALDAELAGVDTARELRRYSILQLWILVPFSLIVLAAIRRGQRP